jgi:hypothetical protein
MAIEIAILLAVSAKHRETASYIMSLTVVPMVMRVPDITPMM